MPYGIVVTGGTVANLSHAIELIEGTEAEHLLADRAYDSDALVEYAQSNGISAVIPPRKNRRNQRYCDKAVYKARCLVEMTFLRLKNGTALQPDMQKNGM